VSEKTTEQLEALSIHLASRREAILRAWREAAEADVEQTTVGILTRGQFNDHIPPLLDAFENKLRARLGGARAARADQAKTQEDVKHGLERWQQGYRLGELMHEWGHLHLCLYREIEAFAALNPDTTRAVLAVAHTELIDLIHEGINKSAGEYARLQQAEAAGHVWDLKQALTKVSEIEQRRAVWIRQAVHDLRTNVQSVSTAAEVLRETEIPDNERIEFANLIQQEVGSVAEMLGDLMALARLEAGQEQRKISAYDPGQVLSELCAAMLPIAADKNLFLKADGPANLKVDGDAIKFRRIVQNLVFNALKYTVRGGVTVQWGEEKESWWVAVRDTGPGLMAGPSAPLVAGLKEATASARETDAKVHEATGNTSTVLPVASGDETSAPQSIAQQPGEGIGLSIVKRLCELLDASTTFRVVFPRRYKIPQKS
jgi:signal transduction histidine kinase